MGFDTSVLNEFKNNVWPLSRLDDPNLTLEEYASAGSHNSFVYWIEKRLERYGSIWGGSAFKFGIYSRANHEEVESKMGRRYNDDYGWLKKHGKTPKEAFIKVKQLVVEIIKHVKDGDLKAIDSIDLGDAYKWKIAFHYQDFNNPKIVHIFKKDALEEYLGIFGKPVSELHSKLNKIHPERYKDMEALINFSDHIWHKYRHNFSEKERSAISIKNRIGILKAEEGQRVESRIMAMKRNQSIVSERKRLDNYTCQNPECGFVYGGYVVEAHHLKPLYKKDKDFVLTNLEGLITLCPTCHRVAHRLLEQDDSFYDKDILKVALAKVVKK